MRRCPWSVPELSCRRLWEWRCQRTASKGQVVLVLAFLVLWVKEIIWKPFEGMRGNCMASGSSIGSRWRTSNAESLLLKGLLLLLVLFRTSGNLGFLLCKYTNELHELPAEKFEKKHTTISSLFSSKGSDSYWGVSVNKSAIWALRILNVNLSKIL